MVNHLFAAKCPRARSLPWASLIDVEAEAGKGEAAVGNSALKLALERFCGLGRHLVLDSDVEPRDMAVLRGERTVEMFRDGLADSQHPATFKRDGRAGAKRHQSADPGLRRREGGGQAGQQRAQFIP